MADSWIDALVQLRDRMVAQAQEECGLGPDEVSWLAPALSEGSLTTTMVHRYEHTVLARIRIARGTDARVAQRLDLEATWLGPRAKSPGRRWGR